MGNIEIKGTNEYNHIILILDSDKSEFIDKTKEIFYLKESYNCYRVGFCNNNKFYNISKKEIITSNVFNKVDFDKDNIYVNNKKVNNVFLIIKFEKVGYKIFLKDNKSFIVNNIKIDGNRIDIDTASLHMKLTENIIFDYYKALAQYATDINKDEDSIEKILNQLYLGIDKINKDSVLYAYTNNSYELVRNRIKCIYPFSTNKSQIKAINTTFNNKLSVISGPPGTGKTQVILNIICNAIVNDMSVAVISNNNTAVKNVYDKMKEEGLDFVLANLGNRSNVEMFFTTPDDIENISKKFEKEPEKSITEIINSLENLFTKQNELIVLKETLFEIKEEYRHFIELNDIKSCSYKFKGFKDYKKYSELKYYLLSKRRITAFTKIKLLVKYHIKDFKNIDLSKFVSYLDNEYYKRYISLFEKEVDIREKELKDNNIEELKKELKKESRIKLNNYLFNKYKDMSNCCLNKDTYKRNFSEFIKRYPIVLSTTQSLLRNTNYSHMYDLVIIDEASQSDILTSLLTMNVAKQMVIIGDEKQLSQIDNQDIYEAADKLNEQFNIEKCYQYKDNSILTSVLSLPKRVPNTILREHYRCDSRIIGFCNKKFYNNELIVCTKTSENNPLFIVHTVEGNHARRNPNGSGQYNDRECQEIINILGKCDTDDIGIITPFRVQADYIKNEIKDLYPNVEVDTIHKYQGRQKKIIILSTVVNNLDYEKENFVSDFVTNSQLLNVAISRAIDKLYLVVSDGVYQSSRNTIAQFIDYIKYYCKEESNQEGKVISIFDKLYRKQQETMEKSPCSKYVDSYAEEIMSNLLSKIIYEYPDFRYQMHYKLSDLVKNYEGFTKDEIKYITNPKTHVDFVIFDKVTYKPALCIEVDGTRYHDYDIVQSSHDAIKDRAIESNGLKILRLKTNKSGEYEKIIQYLIGE